MVSAMRHLGKVMYFYFGWEPSMIIKPKEPKPPRLSIRNPGTLV